MLGALVTARNASAVAKNKRRIMNMSILRRTLPVLITVALGSTASPALSKQEGKAKVKGSQKKETKENNGRQAGELPSGLERYMERTGELPSGLQKKKDEGQLPRGLEKGGKNLESASKGKKASK
jgi:hypothetical protein